MAAAACHDTCAVRCVFSGSSPQYQPVPLLNGKQVMAEFGLKPGPRIGELLEGLREAQATGEVDSETEAWAWLNRYLSAIA